MTDTQDKRQPILLTHGITKTATFGHGDQTPAGFPFMYIVGDIASSDGQKVAGIYSIALPFKSDIHLLGIPVHENRHIDLSDISDDMEQVILEGDYQSHFTLYSIKDQQSLSRYHMDPAAMSYNIDFCSAFHWEIVNNTLYFLDENTLPSLDIADKFIEKITPANAQVDTSNLKIVVQAVEEFSHTPTKLKCPVCQAYLGAGKQWLGCPSGHGYLITGSQMLAVREEGTELVKQLSAIFGRPPKMISRIEHAHHDEITCPNCGHIMNQNAYQTTDIILDICPSCIYRWIDGHELDSILGKYRHE